MSDDSVKRVLKNSISNYLQTLLSVVIFFFYTPYMVRQLGDREFGVWTLVMSVVGIFGLADFGFATSVVKYVAHCKGSGDVETRNKMLSTFAAVYIWISTATTLVGLLFSLIMLHTLHIPADRQGAAMLTYYVLLARFVTLGLPLAMFRGILFGEQRISTINLFQAIAAVCYALIGWYVLSPASGLAPTDRMVALAFVNLACLFIDNLPFVVLCYKKVDRLHIDPRKWDPKLLREAASFGATQLVINVAALVYLRTDPIVVNLVLRDTMQVSYYAIALKISETLYLLTKQFVNVLSPYVAELKGKEDFWAIRNVLLKGSKYAWAITIMISVVIYTLGTQLIVTWVHNDHFAKAGPVLMILVTAMTISMLQEVASLVLAMTGFHKLAAKAAVLGIVVNVGFSFLLGHLIGLNGVAYGTLLTAILVNGLYIVRMACFRFRINLKDYVLQVLIPVVIPAAVQVAITLGMIRILPPKSLMHVAIDSVPGMLVYTALFVVIGLEGSERQKILSKFSRKS